MAVKGSNDGIPQTNKNTRKVTSLISVRELKDKYLFGITIEDRDGKPLPDSAYQEYIDNAVSMLEHDLDISIMPRNEPEETRDYHWNEYYDWGYFQLNNFPVIKVNSIKLVYFRDEDGNPDTLIEMPGNWIRLQPHDGIIRLIPNARFPANLQISQLGNYFPEILRSQFVPHLWVFDYDHGFEDGKIPLMMNQAIALLAAVQALIVGGSLVIGAGIASESISIDGLSQTVNTTNSAENSAYSAQIKEYQRLLYGKNKEDTTALIKRLRDYYKGQTMSLI